MTYENDMRWDVFLQELARSPDRGTALEKSQITPDEYHERCKTDPKFTVAVADHFDHGIDALEDTAVRRAMFGTEEPIYWNGMCVGWKTVYSDRLLTFLLSGNRAKYRGESEKSGNLSDEAKRTLKEVFAEAADLGYGEVEMLPEVATPQAQISTVPRKPPTKSAKKSAKKPDHSTNVIPEMPTPSRPVTALDPELEGDEDFGIGGMSDEELDVLLDDGARPSKKTAKLPVGLKKATAPPPREVKIKKIAPPKRGRK